MTEQVQQLSSPEPRLLADSSVKTEPDNSFQNYLDDEQRRLAQVLAQFGALNFASWFNYSDVNLFQDISISQPERNILEPKNLRTYEQTNSYQFQPAAPNRTAPDLVNKPVQTMLQEILQQTGWLTPNILAQPMFAQAQSEGKLINKLDLQFLIDEILSQVQLVKDKGKTQLLLGLKPENLGEILLSLTAKSGLIAIQISAPEETRKLLAAHSRELAIALKKANIKIAEIKIVGPALSNEKKDK